MSRGAMQQCKECGLVFSHNTHECTRERRLAYALKRACACLVLALVAGFAIGAAV